MEGGNVLLPCQPEGAPLPKLTWSKDGSNMNLALGGDPSHRIWQMIDGDINITQATKSDEGIYTCTATNDLGSGKTSTQLLVLS